MSLLWARVLKLDALCNEIAKRNLWNQPRLFEKTLCEMNRKKKLHHWDKSVIEWLTCYAREQNKKPTFDELRNALTRLQKPNGVQSKPCQKVVEATTKPTKRTFTWWQHAPNDILLLIFAFQGTWEPTYAQVSTRWNALYCEMLTLPTSQCRLFELRIRLPLRLQSEHLIELDDQEEDSPDKFVIEHREYLQNHHGLLRCVLLLPKGDELMNSHEGRQAHLLQIPENKPPVRDICRAGDLSHPPVAFFVDYMSRISFLQNLHAVLFSCPSQYSLFGLQLFSKTRILTLHWQSAKQAHFDWSQLFFTIPEVQVLRLIGFANIPFRRDVFRTLCPKLKTLVLLQCSVWPCEHVPCVNLAEALSAKTQVYSPARMELRSTCTEITILCDKSTRKNMN